MPDDWLTEGEAELLRVAVVWPKLEASLTDPEKRLIIDLILDLRRARQENPDMQPILCEFLGQGGIHLAGTSVRNLDIGSPTASLTQKKPQDKHK